MLLYPGGVGHLPVDWRRGGMAGALFPQPFGLPDDLSTQFGEPTWGEPCRVSMFAGGPGFPGILRGLGSQNGHLGVHPRTCLWAQ